MTTKKLTTEKTTPETPETLENLIRQVRERFKNFSPENGVSIFLVEEIENLEMDCKQVIGSLQEY